MNPLSMRVCPHCQRSMDWSVAQDIGAYVLTVRGDCSICGVYLSVHIPIDKVPSTSQLDIIDIMQRLGLNWDVYYTGTKNVYYSPLLQQQTIKAQGISPFLSMTFSTPPVSNKEVEVLGMTLEPIVAHRAWIWKWNMLWDSQCRIPWLPDRANIAVCQTHYLNLQHVAPVDTCVCGIYGLKEPTRVEDWCQRQFRYAHEFRVYGEVYLWGKVIEGSLGYRAEKAWPKRLIVGSVYEYDTLNNYFKYKEVEIVRLPESPDFSTMLP